VNHVLRPMALAAEANSRILVDNFVKNFAVKAISHTEVFDIVAKFNPSFLKNSI
jgi:hypothetical protein